MHPYEKVRQVDSEDTLLHSDTEAADKSDDYRLGIPKTQAKRRWVAGILSTVLLISVSFNAWWLLARGDRDSDTRKLLPATEQIAAQRSPYSGLAYDVQIPYLHRTGYSSENKTHADEMWESLSMDSLVIAPTPEWVEEMGLGDSWDFPWDPKRKIYFVKVFHQLHCLKVMRHTFHELWAGQPNSIPSAHIEHCLDSLRQDLMCKADDTPMPSVIFENGGGEGQLMQCKDFAKLVAWTKAPERDACYKRLTDYKKIVHTIERYAFCPEDSEHYPAMKQYFDAHGHYADPFAE